MSTDRPPVGIDHTTVVPENADPETTGPEARLRAGDRDEQELSQDER